MTVEEMANETINRLTPKILKYKVNVEKTITQEFDYEIDASSESEARSKAEELAKRESTWDSETEIIVWSIQCDDEEEEIILTDPHQMSLLSIQGGCFK